MRIQQLKLGLIMCILPLLMGCNNTDDVQAIFTGKRWKLSVIKFAGSDKECRDYWVTGGEFDQGKFEASNRILAGKETFTLTFTGVTTDDEISGKATGKAYTTEINNASWRANGTSNDFSIGIQTTNDQDVLATAFLKALSNATSYSGNRDNLYLYFTDGQQNKYLVFHVIKE